MSIILDHERFGIKIDISGDELHCEGMITIERLNEATDRATQDLDLLMNELTDSPPTITRERLKHILESEAVILIARDGEAIIGTATVSPIHELIGTKAWLDSVIVDQRYRGQGIGRDLVTAAIEVAQELGARSLNLTSSARRAPARALYQGLGFEQRETEVYRLGLAGN